MRPHAWRKRIGGRVALAFFVAFAATNGTLVDGAREAYFATAEPKAFFAASVAVAGLIAAAGYFLEPKLKEWLR